MTYWKPETPEVPEVDIAALVAEAEREFTSIGNYLPSELCLTTAHVDGRLAIIKKPNAMLIGSGKTPEEEAAARAPWLVSVPLEPGPVENLLAAIHALDEKLLEVAGPDFLPQMRRGWVKGRQAEGKRRAIAALKWAGPEYKEGRTKKEWGAVAKMAVADGVADGVIPEGLFVKFTLAKSYDAAYELRPWWSERATSKITRGADIMGVFGNYLLKYCSGGWQDWGDGLVVTQHSLACSRYQPRSVDDRCNEDKQEDWEDHVAHTLKHYKGVIPESVHRAFINKAAPTYADFFKTGNPTRALAQLLGRAKPELVSEGEVLEAVNAYLDTDDITPMRELNKELTARENAARRYR